MNAASSIVESSISCSGCHTYIVVDADCAVAELPLMPLINRIIKLEYHVSEQGRINRLILDELRAAKKQRDKFISEQSRRTSAISWVEKQMGVQ